MNSGRVERSLPARLPPHSEGSGLFVKRSDSSCGCVGVFTYDLQQEKRRTCYKKMAVMFSVPYDYNLHSNYSTVGIANTNINCDYALYYEMYYGKDSWFHRINANVGSDVYTKDDLSIKWKMLDTHEPTLIQYNGKTLIICYTLIHQKHLLISQYMFLILYIRISIIHPHDYLLVIFVCRPM